MGALGQVHSMGEGLAAGRTAAQVGGSVGEDRIGGGLEIPPTPGSPHPAASPPAGDSAASTQLLSPLPSRNANVAHPMPPTSRVSTGEGKDRGPLFFSESGSLDGSHKREGSQGWVFGVSSGLCHLPASCPTCRGSEAERPPCSLSFGGEGGPVH